MSYEDEVWAAINTIIDVCIFYDGTKCDKCEAKMLCSCHKPIELKDNKNPF